jgi:hypothetical protein
MLSITKKIIGHDRRRECIKNNIRFSIPEKKSVEITTSSQCVKCNGEMVLYDMNYVCNSCGLIGDSVEPVQPLYYIVSSSGYGYDRSNPSGNGRCNTLNDNGNNMYDSIVRKLLKYQSRSTGTPIPCEILRQVARDYTEICQKLRKIMLQEDNTEIKSHRCNMLLPALLQQRLNKSDMSRTDTYICQFIGKNKSVLTKSINKLNELMKKTIEFYRVKTFSKISAYAYQFLARLDLDTSLSDLVVRVVKRADQQTDMVNFRTCQDETKVVGVIWLILRQIGINISHTLIKDKCFKISKSTYVRYTDFLDINRKKINPVLVGNKPLPVRPIPRSFANQYIGRRSKKLIPLPAEYKGMYLQGTVS